METAPTWLRWARAGTVATVATLLGVVAHAHADGHAPSLPTMAFLVLVLTAAAAVVLARPASTARVVSLTVGGQFVAHYVLAVASPHATGGAAASAGTSMQGMPGMSGVHPGHAAEGAARASDGALTGLLAGFHGLDARMLAAHLAAAVVVGLWLAAGERAVWSVVTHIWRTLRLPALRLPSTPAAVRAPAPRLAAVTLARLASGSVVRRGPPLLLGT
ncbi:hypothetical protein J2X46_002502 [Nocardioides sp. BE266]|uniref:hypothetical protein n=1 Tax=Nocardioides sp. BE266 TaxID=2817725 RepID=UPI00285E3504|nr:hypothetical protein [Nocardioides sp. BE266]MDR7253512.1 hypothetical protein [Nocardioides sp. BE266]